MVSTSCTEAVTARPSPTTATPTTRRSGSRRSEGRRICSPRRRGRASTAPRSIDTVAGSTDRDGHGEAVGALGLGHGGDGLVRERLHASLVHRAATFGLGQPSRRTPGRGRRAADAKQIATRAVHNQRPSGINPERGGFDVGCRMYGAWLAETYDGTLAPSSPMKKTMDHTIDRAVNGRRPGSSRTARSTSGARCGPASRISGRAARRRRRIRATSSVPSSCGASPFRAAPAATGGARRQREQALRQHVSPSRPSSARAARPECLTLLRWPGRGRPAAGRAAVTTAFRSSTEATAPTLGTGDRLILDGVRALTVHRVVLIHVGVAASATRRRARRRGCDQRRPR